MKTKKSIFLKVLSAYLLVVFLVEVDSSGNFTQPARTTSTEQRPAFWTKTTTGKEIPTYRRAKLTTFTDNDKMTSFQGGKYPNSVKTTPRSTTKPMYAEGRSMTTPFLTALGVSRYPELTQNETRSFIGAYTDRIPYMVNYKVPRSYPHDNDHGTWDEKDQTYHASGYSTVEFEPSPYHHHYSPPPAHPPIHYISHPPETKDNSLLTKVALLGIAKLLLVKLKAIGLLKVFIFFLLKVPLVFFKILIFFKGLKILKLLSIPFFILSIILPLLALLPFILLLLAPLLLLPLLALPLLIPLLLPLLFLPIFPVTTPPMTGRRKRSINDSKQGSLLDEKWKSYQMRLKNTSTVNDGYWGDSKSRTRGRPVTKDNTWSYSNSTADPFAFQNVREEEEDIMTITRQVLQAGNCLERVACELAVQGQSEFYQAFISWGLEKLKTYMKGESSKNIKRYTDAYEFGAANNKSEKCQENYKCERPKFYLLQGRTVHKVL